MAGNFNLGAFNILYGYQYDIIEIFPLISVKKPITSQDTTTIALNTDLLTNPSFLGTINIIVKNPLVDPIYAYFTVDNKRIPQALIKGQLYGFALKELNNSITMNVLLSEKPKLEIHITNPHAYSINVFIEIYLTKIKLKEKS